MKTIIMAGGMGTRISAIASDIPKPLIPIDGVPVLEREIVNLHQQGFDDLLLTVSHMADKIMDYFRDGSKWGVHIEYFVEEQPRVNAGALMKLRDRLDGEFLLLHADSVFDIDFQRFVRYHREKGALITLFTHPNNHPYDSGLIVAGADGTVDAWLTKEDARPRWYKNRVNAGLHVINPKALDVVKLDQDLLGTEVNGKRVKLDLDRQVLKPYCGKGVMYCYDSPEYVRDMGTPERFRQVEADFRNGVVQSKNLRHRQRAIFLDRDGTINRYVGFLRDIDQFELLESAAEAIRRINASGYLAIVVTNQPVIARGEVTPLQLQEIHNKMETLLGEQGAYLDAVFYCPHHPHSGYAGEIRELKIDCDCRKPKPGMLLRAARDFNIDLSQSWMVGDGENDVLAGAAAGCRTALIGGEAERAKPSLMVDSLLGFVEALDM